MASKGPVESWIEEIICTICLDFFTDPVTLECGHNFCRSCITRCWKREGGNSCLECREVFADRTLRVNRALAKLAKKARNLKLNPKGKVSKLHCEEHEEELISLISVAAQKHREHRFMQMEDAVKNCKDQLKSSLDCLTNKQSDFQEKEQQQKEKISGVRERSQSLQCHITSQFVELRRIVTEKEQSLLRDIREEEERILNRMEKKLLALQENLRFIQEEITKLKEQMDQKDSVIFLKEEAHQNRRINDDDQELSMTDGAQLFEKLDYPYLLNRVLRETLDAINRVSVTLDVETVNPYLECSEDWKSVRCTKTRRDRLGTGKRFTNWPCVLGSEGFTSGRHYWEVEVTGNWGWCLGVAAESVERKRPIGLSPETGFWIIRQVADELHRDCDVSSLHTSHESRLPVGAIPRRVGVYLSYDFGTVSFYNAETKSHLHTFTGNKFMGKLYPFFRTWVENQWLRICSRSAPDL